MSETSLSGRLAHRCGDGAGGGRVLAASESGPDRYGRCHAYRNVRWIHQRGHDRRRGRRGPTGRGRRLRVVLGAEHLRPRRADRTGDRRARSASYRARHVGRADLSAPPECHRPAVPHRERRLRGPAHARDRAQPQDRDREHARHELRQARAAHPRLPEHPRAAVAQRAGQLPRRGLLDQPRTQREGRAAVRDRRRRARAADAQGDRRTRRRHADVVHRAEHARRLHHPHDQRCRRGGRSSRTSGDRRAAGVRHQRRRGSQGSRCQGVRDLRLAAELPGHARPRRRSRSGGHRHHRVGGRGHRPHRRPRRHRRDRLRCGRVPRQPGRSGSHAEAVKKAMA